MTAEELVGTKVLVTGHIHNVTFKEQNYETGGFAIFRFDIEKVKEGKLPEEFGDSEWGIGFPVTFSGPAPSLSLRQEYEIYAELTRHERFGHQYRIVKMTERIAFDNKDDVFKFFSYIFPEKTTEEILKTLPDPIKVLEEEDVGELLKIKGVGLARADRIIKKYKETRMDCKAYVALYNIGLTLNMIQKLCIAYGSAETLVAKIYENPYMLIYDVNGIGWRKADQIAFDMGIAKDDKRRVIAYIYYILDKMAEEDGHTYMNLDDLAEAIREEVPELSDNKIRTYILDLIKEGKIYYEKTTRRLGLMEHRIIEEKIARELYRIASAKGFELKGASGAILECERSTGFSYSEEQKQAINNCLTNNVILITGLAGAGKSSVMYPVTQIIKNNQRQLAQVALSGKAALNLTEITGVEGSTIHRLLGYNPDGGFAHNKLNPLMYDVIILDEASMVDERIFLYLLEAIPSGSKLIILGDTGQLEPIGIGCVFRDLIESKKIPHTHFNKIFRQAEKSGIITSSREVYDGVPIMRPRQYTAEIRGELKDFEIIGISETNQALVKIVEKYKWFMDEKKATVDDMMIVVAKRAVGDTSARKINESIQRLVNGIPQYDDITIHKVDNGTAYDVTFRVGDKILVTKNCYDTKDTEGQISPVFNGNIGTILSLDYNGMIARFLQGDIFLPRESFIDLELGYAITCHKCVSENTIIMTENGPMRLSELNNGAVIGEFKKLEDKTPMVYNGYDWEKPTHFYNAGMSDGYRISSIYGYDLECTEDHRVAICVNDEEAWVEAKDLKLGDELIIPINYNYSSNNTLPDNYQYRDLDVRAKIYNRPKYLTPELGLFLGLMTGDGTLNKRGVKLFKKNKEVVDLFEELLLKLFNYSGKQRLHSINHRTPGIEVSSADISQYLSYFECFTPNNKMIPRCIFKASKDVQLSFLKGLFEDGGVHMKNGRFDMIEFVSRDKQIVLDTKKLLEMNGILCGIGEYKNNLGFDNYRLFIYGKFAEIFKQKINFISIDKQKKLELIPENKLNRDYRISDDGNKVYIKIKEIIPIKLNAYCLNMERTHMFTQNGILAGNCQGSGYPYVVTVCDNSAYTLLSKEWLYTAITRARKYNVLVAQPGAVVRACEKTSVREKRTWLKEFVVNIFNNQGKTVEEIYNPDNDI